MKKRIFSAILVITMLMTMFTVPTYAATEYTSGIYTYTVSNGTATITKCNTTSSSVSVPSTLGGYSVTGLSGSAFTSCSNLSSITIPASITNITTGSAGSWFYCSKLSSISVNSSNANYSSSDGVLFNKAKTELLVYPVAKTSESYTVPSSTTTISVDAFAFIKYLKNLTIPSSVKSIKAGAFECASSLETVNIAEGVTLDSRCYSLFYNCTSLKTINIPASISYLPAQMFYGCTSLQSIDLSNVTSISKSGLTGYVFYGCTNLSSVTLGNKLTYIGNQVFDNCTSLKTLAIPSSVTDVDLLAFDDSSIEAFTLESGCEAAITAIKYYRRKSNSKLKTITVSSSNSGLYSDGTAVYSKDKTKLYYSNPSKIGSSYSILSGTKTLTEFAFANNTNLTTVVIPEGVTTLEHDVFYGCSNLKSATIPKSVTTIADTNGKANEFSPFSNCNSSVKLRVYAGTAGETYANSYGFDYELINDAVSMPTISYSDYYGGKSISITSSTSGATIYYTTDGTTPSTSSTKYTGAFNITSSKTIKAIATKSGYTNSSVASKTITIYTASAPTSSVTSGTAVTAGSTVYLNTSQSNAKIYYTTNGTTPTTSSTLYTSSGITINSSTTIKAIVVASGYAQSSVATFTYSIKASTYTLTYSANGGSGAPSPQDGTTLTISSTVPTYFPRTFLGWSKSGSATSPGYLPGGTISLTGDTTLYAVWSDDTTLSTSLPTTSNGKISIGGTYRYFKFTPSTSGTYIFESTLSDGDTCGYLYNSAGSQLAYNDDGGSENGNTRNFKISYELTSGTTYYFAAKYYGTSTTGTIPVKLSKQTLKVSTPTMQATNIMGGKRIDISCSTSGATIYYTTNGTTPTTSSTKYTGSFNITTSGTTTVKAIAVCNGYENSDVASTNFSLSKVSTPTASPSGGTITSSTSVSLSCSTSGATIYYTTNGNTPTTSSTKYTGAITISSTTTLKAIAVASGYVNSEGMTCEYTYQDAKQFTMLEDNYRFYNWFDSFGYPYHYEGENWVSDYRIPRERYISVFGLTKGTQEYNSRGNWGGSCFGMASSCGMFYMNYLNYNLYDASADNLFEIAAPGAPNKGLTILIEKYQLVQSYGDVLKERIYNATDYDKTSTASKTQKIIDAVKHFEETGKKPIVLAVRSDKSGHAIFPYKVIQNSDGSYYIYVYDNNAPYGTDNKVYISKDLKSFNYLNNYTRNMTFTYIDTIKKAMGGITLMDEENSVKTSEINVFINSTNAQIMTTDGVSIENIEGAFRVEVDDNQERSSSEYILPIGDYMITVYDDTINELNVSVANDYDYQDVFTTDTQATVFVGVNSETNRVYAIISSNENSFNTITTLNTDGISNTIESEGMILGVSPISNEEVGVTSDKSIVFDGNTISIDELESISTLTGSITSSSDECYIEVKQSTLSKSSNGISGNLSLNVINKTGDILDSNMYVALYDESGKLLSLFTRDDVLYNGTNYINLGSLNYFGLSGNKFKLKIMLWDGPSTIKPISNALEIEIK